MRPTHEGGAAGALPPVDVLLALLDAEADAASDAQESLAAFFQEAGGADDASGPIGVLDTAMLSVLAVSDPSQEVRPVAVAFGFAGHAGAEILVQPTITVTAELSDSTSQPEPEPTPDPIPEPSRRPIRSRSRSRRLIRSRSRSRRPIQFQSRSRRLIRSRSRSRRLIRFQSRSQRLIRSPSRSRRPIQFRSLSRRPTQSRSRSRRLTRSRSRSRRPIQFRSRSRSPTRSRSLSRRLIQSPTRVRNMILGFRSSIRTEANPRSSTSTATHGKRGASAMTAASSRSCRCLPMSSIRYGKPPAATWTR